MTPQLTLLPYVVTGHAGTAHLTEDQFGEFLSNPARTVVPAFGSAEAHLLACERCAAELASLRESISLFRMASNAHADNELRQMPRVSLSARSALSPALEPTWWLAAAAMLLAALLPMQFTRQQSFRSAPAVSAAASESAGESDEALLEDVDRDTSASVPTPMQALADPTDNISSAASVSTLEQRKD